MSTLRAGWKSIGRTSTASFYEIEPHIIAVVPDDGSTDDESSARASVELQLRHAQQSHHRLGVLVFMDPIIEQSALARQVYREAPDPALISCYALVGGTAFGRAVASVFIGICRPRVPTRLFDTEEEALAWARQVERGGP